MWICPTCKSPDHLRVTIEVWAKLTQPKSEPEAFQTELVDSDHEWDSNSVMQCVSQDCATSWDTHIAEYYEVDEPADPRDEEEFVFDHACERAPMPEQLA